MALSGWSGQRVNPTDLIPDRYRDRSVGRPRDDTADALLLFESGLRQVAGG